MRIVAGEFKGRRIDAVPGDSTRPSSDMLREGFASTVISKLDGGFEGKSVLDAFAGSGAIGIEALSRGASRCLFCDIDSKAVSTIESNLAQLPLAPGTAKVIRVDSFALASEDGRRPRLSGQPFDIVYLDPPYAEGIPRVCGLVSDLASADALSEGALIAYEMESSGKSGKVKGKKKDRNAVPEEAAAMLDALGGDFSFMASRSYGKGQIVYLCYRQSG